MRFVSFRAVRALACGLAFTFVSTEAGAEIHPAPNFVAHKQAEITPIPCDLMVLVDEVEFTEGPAPMGDGTMLFSDIGNRILRYNPRAKSISEYRNPSGKANGLMFDARGRLIACEGAGPGGNRRISITDALGNVTTLADAYEGKRFNSPNDLAISPSGAIYFTDPRYGGDEPRELDFEGVYLIDPAGQLRLATRDVVKPNGIAVEPKGRVVYVADNSNLPDGPHQLVAFRILADGTLGDKRVLFDFGPERRGIDGMTLDIHGNLYCAAGRGDEAGIYVFSPVGRTLAFIPLPGDPTNCTFGVRDEARRLYITGGGPEPPGPDGTKKYALYCVDLLVTGYHVFPKPRP